MADSDIKSSPRLAAYRGEARKALREKLNAEKALDDIEATETILVNGYKDLSAPQVGALRAVLESKWKRVAKVLPDLKAVEHDPGEHAENLAREQLNARLAELYARALGRADGQRGEGAASAESGPATLQ